MDAPTALAWVTRIACIGVISSSVEFLAMPREFAAGGLYHNPHKPVRIWWISVRLAAACLALAGFWPTWAMTGLLAMAALTSIALNIRTPGGLGGGEQMLSITLVALTLNGVVGGSGNVQHATLWFLALQSCLAYSTAGIAKARTPGWIDGTFLTGVLRKCIYGPSCLRNLTPIQARLLSMAVIAGETSFLLAILVGKTWVPAFLIAGAAFHICNAWVMGLNIFFWAFGATYPAIWYCSR